MNTFYSPLELQDLGILKFGKNVLISKKSSIYSPETLMLGDNVRIDDFCIISGHVNIGSYVHISAYTALFGSCGIEIGDYSGLSPRCTVFSASDDFSGEYMVGPLISKSYTNVESGKVTLSHHVQIGAGSIILPNVNIDIGVAVGAMSLIKKDLSAWNVYAGNPLRFIKIRRKDLLKFVQ